MKSISITQPPASYNGWVECFNEFDGGIPDDSFEEIISHGSCPEYNGIKAYLHPRIEQAVNSVINSCITELKREVMRLLYDNDISGLHIAFVRFSKRIDKCTFFLKISFLDADFKRELFEQINKEINRFWNEMIKAISPEAYNYATLGEELFLISRIKLFKDISLD